MIHMGPVLSSYGLCNRQAACIFTELEHQGSVLQLWKGAQRQDPFTMNLQGSGCCQGKQEVIRIMKCESVSNSTDSTVETSSRLLLSLAYFDKLMLFSGPLVTTSFFLIRHISKIPKLDISP